MTETTSLENTKNALIESERRYSELLRAMSDGVVQTDADERVVFVNDRFCEMIGYSEEELLGKVTLDLFFAGDERKLVSKANKTRRKGKAGQYETSLKRKSGEDLHVIIGGTPLFDENGNFSGTIGVFTDITQRKQAEDRLHHDAFHDGLTGLANRALFMEHLGQAVNNAKRARNDKFAVLFCDFDRFKVINDSLGHEAGDKLLKSIAERLESGLRTGDLVARFGGDEFTILLNGLQSEQSAFLLAERLQEDLKRPFDIDGRTIFTSASIGISFGEPGVRPEEMMRDADIAMYRSKSKGIAGFQVFDKEMHETAIRRLQLETELRQALERGEFVVYYQPIVELDTYNLSGFEALVRWNHPERGLVAPDDFIPAAEENNMILGIGKWVLAESCRQLKEWQNTIPGASKLKVSVNLSVKEFLQFDLAEQIASTLVRTGLLPEFLKLEITESNVMENSEAAVDMMNRLNDLGLQMSLDDFGTGYSSLSYLHRLPVNQLKIDRSFISRINDSDENREIVNTIIRLAQNLKMKVVAEGIETGDQLAELQALGCEYGQGFFFSTPMDAKTARKFISESFGSATTPLSKQIVTARSAV